MSRLAERIEEAIADGTLPPGAKLPPQRDLAFDIGVTIGTVGRAYALVRERGLVSGEVGRGTFVLGRESESSNRSPRPRRQACIGGMRAPALPGKLRMDSTSAPAVGQSEGDRKADRANPAHVSRRGGRLYARVAGSLAGSRQPLAEIRRLDA